MGYDVNFSPLGSSINNAEIDDDVLLFGNNLFLELGNYNAVVAGTWTPSADSTSQYDFYIGSNGANAEEINYKVALAKGTYKIRALAHGNTDKGTVLVKLGSTTILTCDCYNGTSIRNKQFTDSTVTVAQNGIYTLSLVVSGKNASSSGYTVAVQMLSLQRIS